MDVQTEIEVSHVVIFLCCGTVVGRSEEHISGIPQFGLVNYLTIGKAL